MASFYIRQMLWEVGYPPPIFVILKKELSSLYISQKNIRWMIRYINSVLIKGALAPFCKIGAICDDNDNDDNSKNNKTVRGQ